mgnify:CR=1
MKTNASALENNLDNYFIKFTL